MRTNSKSAKPMTGHLYELGELDDFKVEDKDLDVRGWDVSGGDGKVIGKVEELIVDPAALKVRYLVVKVKKEISMLDGDHFILIPIGVAALVDDHDVVMVKDLSLENLSKYPVYDHTGTSLIRQYERNIREFYVKDNGPEDDLDFYSHEHFNDNRLRRRR